MKVEINNFGIIHIHCNHCEYSQQSSIQENSLKKSIEMKLKSDESLLPVQSHEIQSVRNFLQTLNDFALKVHPNTINSNDLMTLLPISQSHLLFLQQWSEHMNYKVLYRSSRDGLSKKGVQNSIKNKSNVMALFETKNSIFGCFYRLPIPSQPSTGHVYLNCHYHFVFNLLNSYNCSPFRLHSRQLNDKSLIISALDEYTHNVFVSRGFITLQDTFKFIINSKITQKYCEYDNPYFNFNKYFEQEGYIKELFLIEWY
ncbi:hypothetical protein EHI8A_089650 [Entamoeba histolytica HM-1:IMSS-B]|uniref:TLDc domain-containing protein n=6 Tax=Entamoeba histolytica TaxID=5759 RepID=C4MA03_ENTH1|nr:hypothetical protein EHI_144730 [Entamoeba histolytica HM-1:IMSS]EMD48762.1 Hypothetical protein EHI5A_129310 [Entamoeba histolytica KU27]EMH73356.1 hypothetical protein EHI8A_089650 [Entamoeba histolytica HM-1:IMSS-B]EMS13865.1 hypothetical protein KM1_159460 [Entamoeba histolytica HM-3:IMSS]ENY61329.1 hypothetical protein EHI7A_087930 [Entamoeba histolytica HM-1:IMSS-A]GAT98572.1 hypothetical protein CL6EHI_144730 [Entamoeba histolytica]|eukprot:XP_652012.1 hypothetical protein EHI_144730 [Entamoeba histolytica HM-1:IMSS]